MTTNANQNNDSNNVNSNENAGNESSFEFKGFPYVISILGENCSDNENQIVEEKIKGYIDKIAEKCTWGIWYWKKSVIPLFILFDSKNDFIKKILEKKQEDYHDNNRKDRDIVLVAVVSNNNSEYKDICTYNETTCDPDCNGQRQERYFWRPKFDYQKEYSLQRQMNEFLVQHSHLSIIFNHKLDTETDINNAPDDSLIWAIRYKLEGYPGSRYQQEQTEKITYPAIGPIVRIVKSSQIETYFYRSREPITIQDGNKPEEFKPRELNLDYITSCKIENNKDFTEELEIKDNLEILKIVNHKSLKYANQKLEENKKYHIKDLALKDYEISKFDNPNSLVQRLIVYSKAIQKVSDLYQWWTTFVTHAFCLLFLFALACNSSLICINDILITKYGVNIFQIWGWWEIPVNIQKGLNLAGIEYFTNPSIYIFRTLVFLCIGIFLCCLCSFLWIPHQKYHRFQTLADCLRIQAFWKFAGMDDNVSANFRSHQIPNTDWLMITLNGLNIITKGKEEEFSENNINLIDKFWLEDRIDHEFVPIYKKTPFKVVKDSLSRIDNFFIGLYACIFLYSLGCFIATLPFLYIIIGGVAIIVVVSAWLLIKKRFYPQFITVVSLSIVLYGCFTGIFELWRLSTLCDGAQTHNQINVNLYMTETFRLWVQLLASFILVAFLYLRMQMFDKERRRIEQLRSSFNVADYSLDIILNPNDKNIANKIAFKKIEHDKEVANKALKEILKETSFLFNNEDSYSIFRNEYFDNNFIDKLLEKYNIHNNSEHEQEPQKRSWSQWGMFLWKVFRGKDRDDKRINTKDNDKTDSLKNEIQKALLEFYNKKQKEQLSELIKLVQNKNDNFNKLKNRVLDDAALNNNAEENAKKEFCQLILLELGQEVLAKRINWLLDVNDRDLKKPQ